MENAIIRWLLCGGTLMVLCLVAIVLLSGCAGRYYDDNPRNMANMSAEEIERALSQ